MTPDMDDASSVAKSCPGSVRRRRTEAERIEVIKGHVHCGEMEPHRVFCTRCDQWVNLGKKQTYTVKSWEKHRIRCDQKEPGELLCVVSVLSGLTRTLNSACFVGDTKSTTRTKREKMAMMMTKMTVPQWSLHLLQNPKSPYGGASQRDWLFLRLM